MFSLFSVKMDNVENIHNPLPQNINMDELEFHKMKFIYNAIQSGWEVKLKNNNYIFKKKHNNQKEIYLENYIKTFVEENMDFNKLIN